jgi:hypothetical protein
MRVLAAFRRCCARSCALIAPGLTPVRPATPPCVPLRSQADERRFARLRYRKRTRCAPVAGHPQGDRATTKSKLYAPATSRLDWREYRSRLIKVRYLNRRLIRRQWAQLGACFPRAWRLVARAWGPCPAASEGGRHAPFGAVNDTGCGVYGQQAETPAWMRRTAQRIGQHLLYNGAPYHVCCRKLALAATDAW